MTLNSYHQYTSNNVIAFGRNYKDHANELNHEVERLYVFTKAASSLTGDNATIPNHKDITDQLDYEGELRYCYW